MNLKPLIGHAAVPAAKLVTERVVSPLPVIKPAVADVFMEQGALRVKVQGAGAPTRESQLAVATKVLQTLRATSSGDAAPAMTFGGAVSSSGIDASRSLRSYLPSLGHAAELGKDATFSEGAAAFAEQNVAVTLPKDLQSLSLAGVKRSAPVELLAVERSEPVGNDVFVDNSTFQQNWRQIETCQPCTNRAQLTFNDAGVQKMVRSFFGSTFEPHNLGRGPNLAPDWMPMLRNFVRAKELDPGSVKLSNGNVLTQKTWPVSNESAALLRRAAKAFSMPEADIPFNGSTLDKYKATPAGKAGAVEASGPLGAAPRARTRAVKTADRELPAPVGSGSYTSADKANFASNWSHVLIGTTLHHPAWLDLNDASLVRAFNEQFPHPMTHEHFGPGPTLFKEWMPFMRALARVQEVEPGVLTVRAAEILSRKTWPVSPESAALLRRFAKAYGIDEKTVLFNGSTLDLYSKAPPAVELQSAELGSKAYTTAQMTDLLSRRDAAKFAALSDPGVELFAATKGFTPETLKSPDPQWSAAYFRAWDRANVLDPASAKAARIVAAAAALDVSHLATPEVSQALSRLVRRQKIDPASFALADGTNLAANPHFQRADARLVRQALGADANVPERGGGAVRAEAMALLDGASASTMPARATAIVSFLTGGGTAPEFTTVVSALRRAIAEGKLEPVDVTKLSADERDVLFANLGSDGHLATTSILTGLTTKNFEGPLAAKLAAEGYTPAQVEEWVGAAQTLSTLDPALKRFVTENVAGDDADFSTLPMRTALAKAKALDAAAFNEFYQQHQKVDPDESLRAMADWAEASGGKNADAFKAFIETKLSDGSLTSGDISAVLGERTARLWPEAQSAVDAAMERYAAADLLTKESALEALKKTIATMSAFVPPEELVQGALKKQLEHDLRSRLPLAVADTELGGVAAKAWSDAAPGATAGKRVTVAGVELLQNDSKDKDRRAIPRADKSKLVMTPTTERTLKLMAAQWRVGRPVLLEGPTSAGKTSAVRYLAQQTDSPYRRLNLSYNTDVSDLVGRYVGGDIGALKRQLSALGDDELKAEAVKSGVSVGEAFSHEGLVDKILLTKGPELEAEGKARWVDGLLVQAMKRGEVLLLDEFNLARPEVIERLNSLFDDDGNIVLTEHRNEVITPTKNFRVFATMNPHTLAGRAKISEAMRSRWTTLFCQGLGQDDLAVILKDKYGAEIPQAELAKLIALHDSLARAGDDGTIGRAGGGVAFSLRNLFRVGDRFRRYSGGELPDAALMRRETEEVYAGGLFTPEDIQTAKDILDVAMPYAGKGFYDELKFENTKADFTIGDVTVPKLATGDALVPDENSILEMTPRTKQTLYRLAKALDNGENVALIGERASGKTAVAKMYAHLVGQPYHRQMISASTDASALIGGYDNLGWKDGPLLTASRPTGTPGMLLVDEMNFGSSAVLERLNSVLDDERKVVLSEKEGEEFQLHPDFRFVGAMNPPTNKYGGRNKLSVALQNRLTQIYVPELKEAPELQQILRARAIKKGLPEVISDRLLDLHQWAIESYGNGTLGKELRESDRPIFSIRQLTKALDMTAEFQKDLGPGEAFLLAIQTYYAASPQANDAAAIVAKARELAK